MKEVIDSLTAMLRREAENIGEPWDPSHGCYVNATDTSAGLSVWANTDIWYQWYPSIRAALEAHPELLAG